MTGTDIDLEDRWKGTHRSYKWILFSTAATLFVAAWLTSRYPLTPKATSSVDISAGTNLLIANALPWFLQWAGVVCTIFGCCDSRTMRGPIVFANTLTFVWATIWWSGLAIRFRGMDLLDVVVTTMMVEIASGLNSASVFDEILFRFVGPIVGPLQLQGPVTLQGTNYFAVLLSTIMLFGNPLLIGRLCRVDAPPRRIGDFITKVAAIIPSLLPPFIRLIVESFDR